MRTFKTIIVIILILAITITIGFIRSEQQDNEERYQAGIEFIKQGNWEEATHKFVMLFPGPSYDHSVYKEAPTLYKYAEARCLCEQGFFVQAHEQIKDIPYDYDGPFEKDIYFFQKEASVKYQSLTAKQIDQEKQQYSDQQTEWAEQMLDEHKASKDN